MNDFEFADNPAQHRFEIRQGTTVAGYAEYNQLKDALLFTHTEVAPEFEGKGVASRLA